MMRNGMGPVSYPRHTAADRRAVNRFRAVATVAIIGLCCVAITGCTGNPVAYDPDDITIEATIRDMSDACREARGRMDQSSGECILPDGTRPVYTPWCGYLPPVYGDDC